MEKKKIMLFCNPTGKKKEIWEFTWHRYHYHRGEKSNTVNGHTIKLTEMFDEPIEVCTEFGSKNIIDSLNPTKVQIIELENCPICEKKGYGETCEDKIEVVTTDIRFLN